MSTLRTDNIANRLGTSAVPIDTVLQGTAKAWFNLNGTGTIAARDSFNVASFVDNGAGDYSANYSVAQPNANYCSNQTVGDSSLQLVVGFLTSGTSSQLIGSIRTGTRYVSSIAGASVTNDGSYLMVSINGDPA